MAGYTQGEIAARYGDTRDKVANRLRKANELIVIAAMLDNDPYCEVELARIA